MPDDGRSISWNWASFNLLFHGVINLLYYNLHNISYQTQTQNDNVQNEARLPTVSSWRVHNSHNKILCAKPIVKENTKHFPFPFRLITLSRERYTTVVVHDNYCFISDIIKYSPNYQSCSFKNHIPNNCFENLVFKFFKCNNYLDMWMNLSNNNFRKYTLKKEK